MDNLYDLLQHHLQAAPDKIIYRYWQDGGITNELSFATLDHRARALAAHLQNIALPGERVIVALPQSLDPIIAAFACMYSGMVMVPIALPLINRLEVLKRYLEDAKSSTIITISAISAVLKQETLTAGLKHLHWINMDEIDPSSAGSWKPIKLSPDTLAVMLYTSGSTSIPRGIIASHGSILASIKAAGVPFEGTRDNLSISWTPLYHSIGFMVPLHVLGYDVSQLLFSPQVFVQKPITWLKLITEYRPNIACGPTFSFRLCVEAIKPEERHDLNLSSWKIAMTGGEPVRLEVLDQFTRTYEPYGFSGQAFAPIYGLSEMLGGIHAEMHVGTKSIWVSSKELEKRKMEEVQPESPGSRLFVSCGKALPGYTMRIVDPATHKECAPKEIGEVWLAGPAVAQGYWNKPQETEKIFNAHLDTGAGPYLRTGDLGFIKDGRIFICGRLKDVIIINGRNLSALDFELAATDAHPSLMPGASAAFGIDVDGEERVVLMHETRPGQDQVLVEDVAYQVRKAVSDMLKVPLATFVLLKPGSLPRSASGKIQRFQCRQQYLESLAEEKDG
jgi:acyl-CoA synthetase (AMP-forming)/AMP-acid ligase II